MHAVAEEPEEGQQSKQRKLLVAIDDNRACEDAVDWALKEFYRSQLFTCTVELDPCRNKPRGMINYV